MALDSSIVIREQFEITDEGITHTPTGYSLAPDGSEQMGRLGKRLSSGEWYQPDDVREMATQKKGPSTTGPFVLPTAFARCPPTRPAPCQVPRRTRWRWVSGAA
jgi:hypothetical protein